MNKKKRTFSFKQIKKDLKNKKEIKKTFVFLLYFLLIFFLIYLFLNNIIYGYINYIFGYISNLLVNSLLNINTNFIFENSTSVIIISILQYPIYITSLCTGILEFSLLSSAILASKGISLKNRFIGFLLTIPTVFIFNIIRIFITIFILINFSLPLAEFLHLFLFRIFLIILVIGFYYIWFKLNFK